MFYTDVGAASYFDVCYKISHIPRKKRYIYFVARRPEKVNGSDETGGIFRLSEIFCRDMSRISMAVTVKTG
jgi:hypothetical protein